MKAYLIDANSHAVREVVSAGLDGIKQPIGYDSVDSDEIDASGDRLLFDESCFLRDQTGNGRFKLDNLIPVANKAVVANPAGDDGVLKSATVVLAALQQRTI
ncbi:hypothetical protein [Thiobacillus sp.]|uniref:hypothetical protein n=1 Tax=Thiobacillus sp. TaxID=924 RepID=UPI0025F2EEA2|nr:hypothetical protein [Thiobacillus sp.]MBT9540633.1 hypothetical protein [Thiobacillus sp.]